jgi:3-oxoacyl-[acyl-carrier-protein] synthase-1
LLLAVDSLVVPARLAADLAAGRVAGVHNPTGFVPGEAGAALLLSLRPDSRARAIITGAGHCDGGPTFLTAAAVLVEAAERALLDARLPAPALAAICHDGAGDWGQIGELALADGRPPLSLAPQAQRFLPAISTGEVGAASGVLSLAILAFLLAKGVFRRPALALFSSDGAARGAAILAPSASPARRRPRRRGDDTAFMNDAPEAPGEN